MNELRGDFLSRKQGLNFLNSKELAPLARSISVIVMAPQKHFSYMSTLGFHSPPFAARAIRSGLS